MAWLDIREYRVGFPCFLLVNSALSRFLCKNNFLAKPDLPYFPNYKHKKKIIFGQNSNMIISSLKLRKRGEKKRQLKRKLLLISPGFHFFQK